MADHKLLDPNRKAVLRLPHLAFKLWMTYFMSESDDQEAYMSNEVIEERSGMSENTITKWRKWLVKHGWLRPCGGSAAERYSKATRGAHLVLIYRVDDPTKNTATSNFEEANTTPTANSAVKESATANVIPPKFADKVYVSVSSSGCGSGCTTAMPTLSAFGGSESKPVFDLKDENQKQEQQQKQKPRRLRLVQKYDAPFPEGFNDDPSEAGVRFRFEWCEAHRLDKAKEPAPAPVNNEPDEDELEEPAVPVRMSASPTPPPSSAPPPAHDDGAAKAKFQCPACHYSHKAGYGIAEHIEEKHPELGQHRFPVECPQCNWSIAWDKVTNNEAQREAELAEHLERQHSPQSPRYDPWGVCGCKDWHPLSRCPMKERVMSDEVQRHK